MRIFSQQFKTKNMTWDEFKAQIKNDTISAMKNKDKITVETLRSITNLEKSKENKDLNYIDVLGTLAKQRRQSIEAYDGENNVTLANLERKELEVIELYLPKMLSEDTIKANVELLINSQTETLTKRDMGRLVNDFKALYPGQDMKIVSKYIMQNL